MADDPEAHVQPSYVQALYAYTGADASSLSFRQGDIIEVLSTLESGWWDGIHCDTKVRGWFPSNYVQRISEEDALWAREQTMGWWDAENGARRGSVSSTISSGDSLARDFDGMSLSSGALSRDPTMQDFLSAEDLTAFSSGGDIFSEIAAAAQAEGGVPSHSPSASLSRPLTSLSKVHPASQSLDDGEEEDYWVPKMTIHGQLFYYNTRTGETSRDIPIDGQGDGVRIDPSEFSPEEGDMGGTHGTTERSGSNGTTLDGEWSERITANGQGVYYVNLRTGEQSWDPPARPPSVAQTHLRTVSVSDGASLLSAWTERPRPQAAEGVGTGQSESDETKRTSQYSDDSALDVAFADEPRRERRTSVDRAGDAVNPSPAKTPRPVLTAIKKARKPASTAELLGPPPPPLITDLEEIVTRALQELLNTVEIGGIARNGTDPSAAAAERDRLARLGDGVVHAIRLVLHSSGVLEQPILASPFASTISPINEITGPFPYITPLPPSALSQLRPSTRRLVSTLSKLTFSLRAIWGLLETTAEDQIPEEDDSPADPEEVLRRAQIRQQVIAERKLVAAARFDHEAKLRSEIMQGAKDVRDYVLTFLQQFQAVVANLTAQNGGPPLPLELLRAPKALQGSLRTNAAALLLPGGGFGGNWRGNGFVSLPTPHSSPNPQLGGGGELKTLSYAWPTRSLSKELVEELVASSQAVVEQAETFKTAVEKDIKGLSALFEQAAIVQSRLSSFLAQVEDVDIASGVDFQLSRGDLASMASRRGSTATGLSNASDANAELATSAAYRASVLEAKPLLAEFETRKQALYDIAPRLLSALQSLFLPAAASTDDSPVPASQPVANSPLAAYSSLASFDPATSPLDIVNDLLSFLPSICSTVSSLSSIAETQASAPRDLRSTSNAFRSSLFDSIDDSGETAPTSAASDISRGVSSAIYGTAGSRQSQDSVALSSLNSRDSTDSDFFFSGTVPDARRGPPSSFSPATASSSSLGHATSTSAIGTIRSQGSTGARSGPPQSTSSIGSVEVLSGGVGLPPGWERRRGSVATTTSSGTGEVRQSGLTSLAEIAQVSALSPTRSSSKNIQKLLGEGVPTDTSSYEAPKPWYLDRDYSDEELSFTMENTIKGGTLRGLVIAATSHEGRVDGSYLSAFLMTWRTFCTSHELLDQLIDRYLIPQPEELDENELKDWEMQKLKPIRARVTNLLKAWVREYMDHEELDPTLLQRIRDFALNTMSEKGQSLQICKSVDERLQGIAPRPVGNLAPGPLPPPIVPRNLKKIKFLDLEPLELARQLTIMDGRLFQRITPQECLGKAWPKEFGSEAPNISAMIDMSNAVTRWVTETILAQDDQKKRASIVKHFVAIAERCLSLNNFSTLIHIIAGLNSTPIHRLRRTWETVSQKAMVSLGMLNNIMRPDKNYKEYRDVLRKAAPPCVPFLGVYLTDWTFIGDGNPDMLREKPHQINFNKRQKASELILMIKLHQAMTYNLSAVPALAKYLQEQLFPKNADLANDDQRLYELSLMREPRERDDERIARLLGESGFL
ncbi:hypothetical protein JCM21900_006856 [Sporobolomyces salmonicolor]